MASRWRDMLMDYGQVLGDKSSRSSSAYFTVDGDLSDKRNSDYQLRRTLEVHFRPLFQRYVYGGEKLACHDLGRLLRDPEYRDKLPPDKVHELADLADFNRGRSVKYEEFQRIVLGVSDDSSSMNSQSGLDPDTRYIGRTEGVLRVVCRNTVQQVMVDDRLVAYKCLPPPFFMILVTVAQIVAFIAISADAEVSVYPLAGVPLNNTVMYMPTRRREAWRYLTYWLMHQGWIDLVCNCILQLVLGIPLEIIFSWWRMMIVWVVGIMAGSLGQSVSDHYVGLVGAAGGAYAITAAHVVALWQNRKHLNDDKTESSTKRFVCSITLRVVLILIIMVPQFALAVYRRWFYDDINVRIGIAAHVGGLVAGFLLGQAFMKDYKRYPWQDGAGYLDLFLVLIFIGASIIFNIVWADYPPEDYS